MTLSPVPGFAAGSRASARATSRSCCRRTWRRSSRSTSRTGGSNGAAERLEEPLRRAAATYFLSARRPQRAPVDPVARFHLGNGARLEQLDFLADLSEKGFAQSHGLMVNYQYELDEIEKNHEAFAESRTVVAANGIRKLARVPREMVKV